MAKNKHKNKLTSIRRWSNWWHFESSNAALRFTQESLTSQHSRHTKAGFGMEHNTDQQLSLPHNQASVCTSADVCTHAAQQSRACKKKKDFQVLPISCFGAKVGR